MDRTTTKVTLTGLVLAIFFAAASLDATAWAESGSEWLDTSFQADAVEPSCSWMSWSSGVVAYAEWLNWQAHRGGLDFASFVDPVWETPGTVESLDYERDNGVRVGLGYRFESQWDVTWNYTYFQASAAGAVDQAENPNLSLIATRSYLDTTFASVAAQADLDYNVHDIEAGRRLVCNSSTAVRLFGGFRWARIDQSESQQYTYEDSLGDTSTGDIRGRSELDAYGIRLGAETQWDTRWGLGLFGRLAGSVLVGNFDVRQQEVDEIELTIMDFVGEYYQAVPAIDAAAGAAWTCGAWHVAGGYEMTSWFNLAAIERASYDLILDGFFLRVAYAR